MGTISVDDVLAGTEFVGRIVAGMLGGGEGFVFEAEFFAAQLHGDRLFFGDDVFADPDGAYRGRLGGHAQLFLRAGHHEWVAVLGWVHRRGWGRGGDSGGGFGPAGGKVAGGGSRATVVYQAAAHLCCPAG